MSESETWVLVTTFYQLHSKKAIPKSVGLIVFLTLKAALSVRFPSQKYACMHCSVLNLWISYQDEKMIISFHLMTS